MKQTFLMPDGELRTEQMPQFKTPWNHDTNFESQRTAIYCNDPSLTKQEFKEDADINVLIERFMRGGDLPPPVLPEHFTDLSGRPTYFEMQTKVAEANATFYKLDAELRAEHGNDPTRWADAVVKAVEAKDGDKLLKLGLTLEAIKPQTPEGGTPPSPATPGAATSQKAPEAPTEGGNKPAERPAGKD